jgi:hypothetical protein
MRDHILNTVTPSTALLPIENDMSNGSLTLVRLIRSLKGYRPDHVITILGVVAWNYPMEFREE